MVKVFIADDSAIICGRLLSMLSEFPQIKILGFSQTAAEMLSRLDELRPDAIVLDIRMPGGSGIDALEVIKNKYPDTCVIMFTNYPYPEYRTRCLEAGANYFLDKSTEFDEVSDILLGLAKQRVSKPMAEKQD